ncbi:hypothetical protein TRAPUB_11916 [Trametes pubescens]|uniref:Uncharacterized protein n=1 Tax=Trametes pubescens TaxID=154538 RepID=A0A1M2VVC6_TRAPU|nr:hypothetical protein TRAPUB_11916 [Trametes pubescens]
MPPKRTFAAFEQHQATSMSISPPRAARQHADSDPIGRDCPLPSSSTAPAPRSNHAPETTARAREASPQDDRPPVKKRKLERKRREQQERSLEWQEEMKTFPSRPDILHDHQVLLTSPSREGEGLPEDNASGPASDAVPCVAARSPASLGTNLAVAGALQPSAARMPQTQEDRLSPGLATPSLTDSTAFGGEGWLSPRATSPEFPHSSALTPTEEAGYTVSMADLWLTATPWGLGVDTSSSGSMTPPLDLAAISQPPNEICAFPDPFAVSLLPLEPSQATYAEFFVWLEDNRLRGARTFGTPPGSLAAVFPPSGVEISGSHPHGIVDGAAAYYRRRFELATSPPPRSSTRRSGSLAADSIAPPPPAFYQQMASQWPSSGISLAETMGSADFRNWNAPQNAVASAFTADDGSSSRTSAAASVTPESALPRTCTYADSAHLGLGYGLAECVAGRPVDMPLTGQVAVSPNDMPPLTMPGASMEGTQGYRQPSQTESSLARWNSP